MYIETHRLRSHHWASMVAAAGPLSNWVSFMVLAALVHPRMGLIDPADADPPMWAMLLGAVCVLELFSVLFNLIPIPPLDGFGIIEPYLSPEAQMQARAMGWGGLFVLFLVFRVDAVREAFMRAMDNVLQRFGLPFESTWRFYNIALFGSSE